MIEEVLNERRACQSRPSPGSLTLTDLSPSRRGGCRGLSRKILRQMIDVWADGVGAAPHEYLFEGHVRMRVKEIHDVLVHGVQIVELLLIGHHAENRFGILAVQGVQFVRPVRIRMVLLHQRLEWSAVFGIDFIHLLFLHGGQRGGIHRRVFGAIDLAQRGNAYQTKEQSKNAAGHCSFRMGSCHEGFQFFDELLGEASRQYRFHRLFFKSAWQTSQISGHRIDCRAMLLKRRVLVILLCIPVALGLMMFALNYWLAKRSPLYQIRQYAASDSVRYCYLPHGWWPGHSRYVVVEQMDVDKGQWSVANSVLLHSLAKDWEGGDCDLGMCGFDRRNANNSEESLTTQQSLIWPGHIDYVRELTTAEVIAIRATRFGVDPFETVDRIP